MNQNHHRKRLLLTCELEVIHTLFQMFKEGNHTLTILYYVSIILWLVAWKFCNIRNLWQFTLITEHFVTWSTYRISQLHTLCIFFLHPDSNIFQIKTIDCISGQIDSKAQYIELSIWAKQYLNIINQRIIVIIIF